MDLSPTKLIVESELDSNICLLTLDDWSAFAIPSIPPTLSVPWVKNQMTESKSGRAHGIPAAVSRSNPEPPSVSAM